MFDVLASTDLRITNRNRLTHVAPIEYVRAPTLPSPHPSATPSHSITLSEKLSQIFTRCRPFTVQESYAYLETMTCKFRQLHKVLAPGVALIQVPLLRLLSARCFQRR